MHSLQVHISLNWGHSSSLKWPALYPKHATYQWMGIISSCNIWSFIVVTRAKRRFWNAPVKVKSCVAINMLEQRASDLSSLPCTWFSHWNFVIDPTPIWAFWSNKSVELRVWKHQGLSIFRVHTRSQVSALGQSSPSVGSVWLTGGSWWVQCATLGLPGTAGPDTGPPQCKRPSSVLMAADQPNSLGLQKYLDKP